MSAHKDDPEKMAKMAAWLQAVSTELNLEEDVIETVQTELLDLISEVAHGPSRPGAPLTAFLVGYHAAGDPKQALEGIARLQELVKNYKA